VSHGFARFRPAELTEPPPFQFVRIWLREGNKLSSALDHRFEALKRLFARCDEAGIL
jgi:hypothetical protein